MKSLTCAKEHFIVGKFFMSNHWRLEKQILRRFGTFEK